MVSTRTIQITNHHGLRPDGIDKVTFPPGLKENILRSGKVKYFVSGDTLRLIHRLSKTKNKYLTVPPLRIKKKSGRGEKDVYLKESFIQVTGQENGYSLSLLDAIFLEPTLQTKFNV